MQITKYGHCCLLIEYEDKRILTDPGAFSVGYESLTRLDLILITHEHADHYHVESLKPLLEHNPGVTIVTNSSVGNLLTEQGIAHTVLEGDTKSRLADIALQAIDGEHVEIIGDYGIVQNTGYFIAETFFYPGDAYTVPDRPVKLLGLPVAGPWCKVSEAIAYALEVAPVTAIPVHDAVLSEAGKAVTYPHFARELATQDIEFAPLTDGKPKEFTV